MLYEVITHLVDVDRHLVVLHQRREPDEILVRRALVLGRGAQRAQEARAIPDREDGVGVAAVDAEEHDALLRRKPRPRGSYNFV